MRIGARTVLAIVHLGIAGIVGSAGAHAQTITNSPTIALKSGESIELGDLFWAVNCMSVLKSTPEFSMVLQEYLLRSKQRWSRRALRDAQSRYPAARS